MPTLKANIKAQKRDYKTALGGDKKDLASGIMSTISGFSSVFTGVSSVMSDGSTVTQAQVPTNEGVSELFFDPRLK
jgi:hypothetical protein